MGGTGVRVFGVWRLFLVYWNFPDRKDSQTHEGWYSPRVQRSERHLRLWPYVQDPFHPPGRYPRGDLLRLPSLLHRTPEAGRHRRPHRSLREEVLGHPRRQEATACLEIGLTALLRFLLEPAFGRVVFFARPSEDQGLELAV